jgi:hypothetical protein
MSKGGLVEEILMESVGTNEYCQIFELNFQEAVE